MARNEQYDGGGDKRQSLVCWREAKTRGRPGEDGVLSRGDVEVLSRPKPSPGGVLTHKAAARNGSRSEATLVNRLFSDGDEESGGGVERYRTDLYWHVTSEGGRYLHVGPGSLAFARQFAARICDLFFGDGKNVAPTPGTRRNFTPIHFVVLGGLIVFRFT
ncbi:hypothetical protein GWI33_010419 [Rhynchophorus ferrugineus]|uniref:Uncharacterized protein n=1 Tax=Rhynchophorus ferrugineus TaxID=354439 RepID=A0A834MNG4_RHYFE|nr:hypothetical protein GWI33_010419 [Rhynchophorus ferrugineus]